MKLTLLLRSALLLGLMGATGSTWGQVVKPAEDPNIEVNTKAFLNALNSSGGKPIETLSPADARAVLTGAQKSVKVDLSGVSVTYKTIRKMGMSWVFIL